MVVEVVVVVGVVPVEGVLETKAKSYHKRNNTIMRKYNKTAIRDDVRR